MEYDALLRISHGRRYEVVPPPHRLIRAFGGLLVSDVRGVRLKGEDAYFRVVAGRWPEGFVELSLKLVVWVFFGLEKEAAVHAFVAPGVDEHVQTTVAESWVEFFRRQKLLFASFFF